MTIAELLKDKTKKTKVKTETINTWLLDGTLPMNELIDYALKATDSEKATCIEAIEYATKQHPTIVNDTVFNFVTNMLTDKAPRVKWESARVIGNIAHLFPTKLHKPISHLLTNTENDGTVVRWASSYALGEIIQLKSKHNKTLIPAIEAILDREQDNAIKKKYFTALKKVKK